MPSPPDRSRRRSLTRADLPADLTPETLRHLDLQVLRRLSRPGNGILDADEQRTFDAAIDEVRRTTSSLIQRSLERAQAQEPANLDPAMRRSYARTQQRLAEQARRAGRSFPLPVGAPNLDERWEPPTAPVDRDAGPKPIPTTPTPPDIPDSADGTDSADAGDHAGDDTGDDTGTASSDDVSPAALEHEVEQTSDTLDMLERIASLQQEQVEHQHNQLLTETRGIFFAFLVSVAVIVAGVAPLVEAEPHERLLIIVWTVGITAAAGLVYALVRAAQAKKRPAPDRSDQA